MLMLMTPSLAMADGGADHVVLARGRSPTAAQPHPYWVPRSNPV